ncbi:MAG TPA: hypothetical protein DEP72_04040 [Clostridiales bacterium]|nr:MAG: hypothetical protein A2Y18_04320 [Clostridiales bacterium GWD2_32_19]HCC07315.1 hypothetical protein [Clostridiales bacterium]
MDKRKAFIKFNHNNFEVENCKFHLNALKKYEKNGRMEVEYKEREGANNYDKWCYNKRKQVLIV